MKKEEEMLFSTEIYNCPLCMKSYTAPVLINDHFQSKHLGIYFYAISEGYDKDVTDWRKEDWIGIRNSYKGVDEEIFNLILEAKKEKQEANNIKQEALEEIAEHTVTVEVKQQQCQEKVLIILRDLEHSYFEGCFEARIPRRQGAKSEIVYNINGKLYRNRSDNNLNLGNLTIFHLWPVEVHPVEAQIPEVKTDKEDTPAKETVSRRAEE